MSSLDELRERFPPLGFAVYALEPGGVVTLEVLTPDGALYRFDGPTLTAAIEAAWPPEPPAFDPAELEAPPAAPIDDVFA